MQENLPNRKLEDNQDETDNRAQYHFLKGNNISNKAVSSSSTIQLNPIFISITLYFVTPDKGN
jgi:hypothetical protein